MKIVFGIGLFIVLLVVLGTQIYSTREEERQLRTEYEVLQAKLLKLETERVKLEEELNYLSNPENLEKELKGRFNYKREGEKLIIIVPPAGSSTEP